MDELLARVEAATGPDRDLDGDLWWVLSHPDAQRCFNNGATGLPRDFPATLPIPAGMGRAGVRAMAPDYSASLDAALALVERKLPGRASELLYEAWSAVGRKHALHMRLWKPSEDGSYTQALILALLAALLRALIAQEAAAAPTARSSPSPRCSHG